MKENTYKSFTELKAMKSKDVIIDRAKDEIIEFKKNAEADL
jgi:hypothetical protein